MFGTHNLSPTQADDDIRVVDWTPEEAAAFDARSARHSEITAAYLRECGVNTPYELSEEKFLELGDRLRAE